MTATDTGTVTAVFTVTLSAPSSQPVTVYYATADGTATAGSNDYVPISGTLTFAPGETTMTITVVVNPDKKKDADETFFVDLSGAVNALVLDDQGLGLILSTPFRKSPGSSRTAIQRESQRYRENRTRQVPPNLRNGVLSDDWK